MPAEILILGDREVRDLLPIGDCVEVMADALRSIASAESVQPMRTLFAPPGNPGFLGLMPAYLARPATLGIKVLSLFPGNSRGPLPTHQGGVMIFECESGRPLALVDAASITEIRTAAVSALATRALARTDSSELAMLGAGTQAEAHVHAMNLVRRLSQVRIWSRRTEQSRVLAERLSTSATLKHLEIASVASASDAVLASDIICTTTASRTPVLEGRWVRAGTHINAVGASTPGYREIDSNAIARSRLYVDRRESAEAESDDYRIPLREGTISGGHIVGELGELLLGRVPGRRTPEEITLFESVGIAVEDVAAARSVYDRAVLSGRGTTVAFGADRSS